MKRSLCFSWYFVKGFTKDYLEEIDSSEKIEVDIPHSAVLVPYNYFSELDYQGIFTYEKYFDIDDYQENQRYFIKFMGFMFKAKIFINGNFLGEYASGYLPVEVEISKFAKKENNRLLVLLDSYEDKDYPPFGFALDYLTFAGIYREVYLLSHPKSYLDNFYIHADNLGNVNVIYNVIAGDEEINEGDYQVTHILLNDKDEEIFKSDKDDFKVENISTWDLDNPTLYKLKTIYKYKDIEESYINRFAFKKAVFKDNGFYLNDKKIKLVGLNRHQGYPFMGYAASKSLQESDALLLKKTGLNVVRTSHYPQSENFLNKCDEIGLLVIDEIPGWQHIGESTKWKEECILNTKRMVLKERNHPCIIAYGVRIDESVDNHDLYLKTNHVAHILDKYRQTIGVRNFKNSELLEDVYGYNDFICNSLKVGLEDPKKVTKDTKKYLVTEYMGHMDPVKATSDIDKQVEVALRHFKVLNDNYKYVDTAGAIGWCFVDYHSHADFGSGDHICPHGVYDFYRNPKLSSYVYASNSENEPVLTALTNFKPGDQKEAIFSDLLFATNLDYLELYKDNEYVASFKAKKDNFPNLKHPPILINDIVGETFKEDKIPNKKWPVVAKMFSYAAMHGFNNLPLKVKATLGIYMMKYKISYTDLVGYWNKYIGAWGGKAKTYEVRGYKNGVAVKSIHLGPSDKFKYEVSTSKDVLVNLDTYDTLEIRVRHLDSHDDLLRYSNRIINISIEGPIRLIGETSQALLGGQITIYVASINKKGKGKIILSNNEFKKEIVIDVK